MADEALALSSGEKEAYERNTMYIHWAYYILHSGTLRAFNVIKVISFHVQNCGNLDVRVTI